MSENRSKKQRILLYALAIAAVAVIVWIIFWGTNVFNYLDRAGGAEQEQTQEQED